MAEQPKTLDKKKEPKEREYKGVHIKRDKGGKGFSMMIRKKIKGFEEEAEMGQTPVNEVSKYLAKRYIKGATKSIANIAKSQAGGTSDEEGSKADLKIKNRQKGVDKAAHRLTGKYYPKYVRQRNPFGGGTRKYEGSSHGEGLYKPKVPGGTYPPGIKSGEERERYPRKMGRLGKYRANEEIDTPKEQLDETSKEKAKAYLRAAPGDLAQQEWKTGSKHERGEREDQEHHARKGKNRIEGIRRAVEKVSEETEMNEDDIEVQEPNISDLVVHAIDQKPLDFQQSFADLMRQRIEDSVHEKKLEIAAGFAGANTESPEEDDYIDEPKDDEDKDWDGTEFEPDDEDLTPGEPDEAAGVEK